MDIQIQENKDSLKLNKSSVGVGWELKIYRKDNETNEQLINRLKKIHKQMEQEFPGVQK